MPKTSIALAVIALTTSGAVLPAKADSCRGDLARTEGRRPTECRPEDRVRPYDPDRKVRSGSAPGFIDLGNGTEVRVGGDVRLDYNVRR